MSAGESGDAPLAAAQARLLALQDINPRSSAYSSTIVLQLVGHLDIGCLQGALNRVLARHDILRTSFPEVQLRRVQRVAPELNYSLKVTHLAPLPTRPEPTQIAQFIEQCAGQPFSLTEAPLLRLDLLGLGAQQHLLVLVVHQIICDVPSRDRLLQELFLCYEAFRQGQEPDLPQPELQYADYAYWESEQLKDEESRTLDYWKTTFAKPCLPLHLPGRAPVGAPTNHSSAFLTAEIPTPVTQRVQKLARENGTTLFAVLLTSYACLLRAECEQADMVVFAPFERRECSELESVLGLFVNQIPLRLNLEKPGTFQEFLGKVTTSIRDAFSHQTVRLSEVIDLVSYFQGETHRSIFQTTFTVLDEPSLVSPEATFKVSLWPQESGSNQFDIGMAIVLAQGGLIANLEYRTSLFKKPAMERFLQQWLELLDHLTGEPQTRFEEMYLQPPQTSPIKASPVPRPQASEHPQWQAMCRLWEDVLGVPRVGPHEDFFELGGHSLKAATLVSRIQDEYQIDIPPGTLLDYPTVAGLVARLEAQITSPILVTLRPGAGPALFVVPGGWGGVLGFRDFARAMPGERAIYGLDFEGTQASDRATLESVAECYVRTVRRKQPEGPYYLMGFSFGGSVAYEMARILNGDASQLIILDSLAPGFRRGTGSRIRDWVSKAFTYAEIARIATMDELREMFRRRLALGFGRPEWTPEIWLFLQHSRTSPRHVYEGAAHLLRYSYQPRWVNDFTLGWSKILPRLTIHKILGTHGSMSLGEPVISRTAALVERIIQGQDHSSDSNSR